MIWEHNRNEIDVQKYYSFIIKLSADDELFETCILVLGQDKTLGGISGCF